MAKGKSKTGLFIFTLGVMMLLLRPFAVYQITAQHQLGGNPAKAWSLLQRLVNKKDEHHEAVSEMGAMESAGRIGLRLIRPALLIIAAFFIRISKAPDLGLIGSFELIHGTGRYRYRLLSCLQI